MNILHLIATPSWSGPLDNVALLALAQRRAGHEVWIVVDRLRTQTPAEEPAIPRLQALGLLGELPLTLSVKSSPGQWLRDLGTVRGAKVDVLHAHMSHDHFLARWARNRRAVLVRSIHAPRSLRWSLPHADAYTVPFRGALDALDSKAPSWVLPALRPPGFAPAEDRAALRRALGLEGEPLVGMISTFQRSRRHDVGLRAMQQLCGIHPGARLVLVGDGQLEPELRQQVQALGLSERVVFTGYLEKEVYLRHLQALDQVWILGLGNDWSARAAVQAKACGVRVIAVREGALPEWADVLCEPVPGSVVQAALAPGETRRVLPSNDEVAARVFELYAEAARRASRGGSRLGPQVR